MKPPCTNCERKGCGSYHDECEAFQKFHEKVLEVRKARSANGELANTFVEMQRRHQNSRMSDRSSIRRKRR